MTPPAETMLPLKAADLQILLVLLDGDRHGYGIMKEVERTSNGRVRLEVGSLYRVLARLLSSGLVEDVEPSASARPARQRRLYRVSDVGREVAAAEIGRLDAVVQQAHSRGLVTRRKRA